MDLVTRKEFGWPAVSSKVADAKTNLGMVAHFDGERGLLTKWKARGHAACLTYWKTTREFHIQTRGWLDVGYAYFACPCGKILEGRGFGKQQAAEAPTPGKLQNGNSRYVAVTFGTGIGEVPTGLAVEAFRELRAHLMAHHGVAGKVYGHRDFTSTDCPGDVIYGLVKNGTLSKDPLGDPKPEVDDDMKLPTLSKGMDKKYDVLTLRALLFQRFLAEHFTNDQMVDDRHIETPMTLFTWMRREEFDEDLEKDVKAYQEFRKLDADGIVGPKTWAELTRTAK